MSTPTIFDFTKADILPIVTAIASAKVDDFDIRFDHQKVSPNGICGEYLVPTITYKTGLGDSLECTLFVRRRKGTEPGRFQTHHYTFLSENGVPVPRLYGVLSDSQGREVLFLEYLDEVTVANDMFYKDLGVFQKLLEIMARLNSIKLTVEYAADVGRDMARREGYTRNWNTWLPWSIHVLNQIEKYAERDLLDSRIKQFYQFNQGEIKTLKRIALELMHIVPNLPVGLIHGDFLPGNTGWRKKRKELVVFDFEDVMFDTRFYDVAFILGGQDTEEKHSAIQRDLAEVYLKVYSQYSGITPNIEDFLKELTIVWYARKLNLWEYLPPDLHGLSYESGVAGNTRQTRLDLLYENMSILVSRATKIEALLV